VKVPVVYVNHSNREAAAIHINRSRQKIYATPVVEECDKLYKNAGVKRQWLLDSSD
jgi:hypothetical protein